MDEININIEETNFCTIVQNDVSDFTVNLENPTTNFCVEVQEGIGALPHTHPISDIIGLQSELDGLHTDVTNIENTLDLKADLVDGKVPSSQLPSFVDDVLEFSSLSAFPVTGESGKIYVALDTNLTYRWSGSTYAEISPSLALGETSTTAYRGDRGKIAYDHSRIFFGNPHGTTLDMVTDAGNTTDNDIHVKSVSADYYDVNINPSLILEQAGRILWNSEDGTYDMGLYNGVTLQAGQEQHFYGKAVGSIANGSPVQFAGSQGNHFLIKTAVASEINANPELFMGIATQSFTNNQFGYVTMFGNVRDLNTSAYTDGTLLYFDSVNGGLTSTKPAYPNARILVCAVTNSHVNQGSLFVRPEIQRYGKWNEIVNQPSTFTPSAHTHAIADITNLQTSLDSKVDKITGKGLSTEDYTTTEKNKLAGIQSGAEVNVNADWNATSGDAQILNKPSTFPPSTHTHAIADITGLQTALDGKQSTLVSGTNIKTINGNSLLGSGDISISGLSQWTTSGSNIYYNGGNVGIGTESPTSKLDIRYNSTNSPYRGVSILDANSSSTSAHFITFQKSDESTIGIIRGSGTSNAIFVGGIDHLGLGSNNIERMRITSSGNVGIGTISPATKLDINGSANGYAENIRITSSNSYGGLGLWKGASQIGILGFGSAGNIFNNSLTDAVNIQSVNGLQLGVGVNAIINILSSGNVGIGTTSPDRKLTVRSDLPIRLEGENNPTGYYTLLGTNWDYDKSFLINNKGDEIFTYSQNETLGLHLSNPRAGIVRFSTNGSERMRITSSGNVGIGTTNPTYKLYVSGSALFVGAIRLSASTTDLPNYTESGWAAYSGSTLRQYIGDGSGYDYRFAVRNAGIDYDKITIKDNGNVGIGTTSPATKLDVAGAITASGGFFNSDIRLKEITDYEYSVSDIKPITYTWKDKRDDKKHIGYSAQEVQKVMPDAVNEDAEGMLSINYVEILVAKIFDLENRIKQLENGLE